MGTATAVARRADAGPERGSIVSNVHTHRRARVAVLLLCTALPACDVGELLDARQPGAVPEEALNDPTLASTLTASVVADFECAWNNYVAGSALISDQFIQASGNLNQRNWGTRRVTADDDSYAQDSCSQPYGIYSTLHTARFQAEDVFARLSAFTDDQVAERTRQLATVRIYGAYSMVALGEGFCEMAMDLGPLMTPREVLELAEERFTEGLALAEQAADTDLRNLALVGRARVRLDLEDFAGAIADATPVPVDYLKNATRDETSSRRYNALCAYLTCAEFGRHASVAPNYREIEWQGVPDPRVKVTTADELSFDNATVHWYPADIARSRADPVPIASGTEAQLIIAEAAASSGDLATARRIIEERHALAGIPPYDPSASGSQSEVIAHVIEERRRELFLEGGHRLNDHLRFRGTEWEVPFKGDPGSIHPNGVDHTGVPYGSTTCFELPTVERNGNPNLSG